MVLGIIAFVLLAALFVPGVSQVILGWIPAALSVFAGVSVPGDVRFPDILQDPVQGILKEIALPARESMLAQVPAALNAGTTSGTWVAEATGFFQSFWTMMVPLSVFCSLLFLMGIVYVYMRLHHVEHEEGKRYVVKQTGEAAHQGPSKMQMRWAKITEHANSTNENDWRHAILDADIMLDELLDAQGYKGDTMGDKLKQVERSDFRTIDSAWEAHKVRNKIAHEGSALSLNDREVRRVISLFEQVFKEFHLV